MSVFLKGKVLRDPVEDEKCWEDWEGGPGGVWAAGSTHRGGDLVN